MSARRLFTGLVGPLVALVVASSLLPPRAHAQTFEDSFPTRLNTTCAGLRGSSSSAPGAGTYGPQLAAICTGVFSIAGGGKGKGSGSGTTTTLDTHAADPEEQRLLKRLRERRQRTAASADDGIGGGGLSLYGSSDYQYAEKEVTHFEAGYRRDTYGATLGADYRLPRGMLLVGMAFNYARESGTYAERAGRFETESLGPTLYASVFPTDDVFVDAYVGYTRREYDLVRHYAFTLNAATAFPAGRTEGETSGDEYKAGINAGCDFHVGRVTIGPRVGLDFRENRIDGYAESGATGFAQGLELVYDAQHQTSLTSKVGAFASMAHGTGWGVLVPQATIEWRHEFLDDQRVMYFSFKQDLLGVKFRYQSDPPDRDYFNASLGVVALLPNGLAPFVNVRQFFGYRAQWSTTATAGLRVSF